MAKRGAGDQLTKDDYDERGGDDEDPGTRETPLAPVAGRQIRGMPKRKGLTPAAEPAAPTPAPAAETAPKPSPFAGFAFGASSSTPSSTSTSSFSFGKPAAPATSTAPAASPFSGFSFKPAAAPAATAPETASAAEKRSTEEPEAPAAKKPFSGFSFTPSAPAAAPSTSTSASTTSGFSFGSTGATAAASSKPSTGTFSFGQTSTAAPSTSAPSTGGFSFGKASGSASKTTSDAPKDSTATSQESAPSAPAPAPAAPAPAPSSSTAPPEGEVKYYTSLRGLNTSILSFLTTTLENDAFVNLGQVLPGLAEQYNKLLEQEATKAGWKPPTAAASSATPKPVEEPKMAAVAPPAVPSGGFTFGGQTSTASTAAPSGAKGFTPTLPASGSSSSSPFSFSFGVKPAEQSKQAETPKKPSAEVTKLVQDVISGKDKEEEKKDEAPAAKPPTFTFGAPSASTSTPASGEKKAGSGLFSFAPSGPFKPATPDSKSFSPSANLESVSSSTPPAKLGKFGPGGSAPQLPFGGAATTPSTPGGGKPAGFSFGASPSGEGGFSIGSGAPFKSQVNVPLPTAKSTSSSTPSFSFGSPATSQSQDKPAPSFSFGASSTSSSAAPPSSGFTFTAPTAPSSKPGQSTGSSTFTFGAGSKPATSTFAAPSAFSSAFGKPAATSEKNDNAPTESEEASADKGESGEAPESSEPSVNHAETGGAGEEDEETLYANRAKLYKLVNGSYEAIGLGALKLKKKTEDNKRRLLMRTDGNGVVILNMAVTSALAPTADKTSVKFVGSDLTGQPMVYMFRVKTADMANEFVSAVNKEVEAIKSEQ